MTQIVARTKGDWRALPISWHGGALNSEPAGWKDVGFDDSAWETVGVVPSSDPVYSFWDPVAGADPIVCLSLKAIPQLWNAIWITRREFVIPGPIVGDGSMSFESDDGREIWVNGHLEVNEPAVATSATVTVPAAHLVEGVNVVAVRVTNLIGLGDPNRWLENPTIISLALSVELVTDPQGWDVFDGGSPRGDLVAVLENAYDRLFRVELDGSGSGSFKINRNAAEARADVLKRGNIVKVRIPELGAGYVFAFILETGDFTLLSTDEEGGEELSFGGRGVLAYLDRARMWSAAFTTGVDINEVWTEIWQASSVNRPIGTAYDAATPTVLYVIDETTRRIYSVNQTTRAKTALSPALFSHYAGGLSLDPADATIIWALEAPWLSGSSAASKIHKVRRSDWAILATFSIGTDSWTSLKSDGSNLWLTNYTDNKIYKKSRTTGGTVASYTIAYAGAAQTKPNGISINGTKLGYWFGGTAGHGGKRMLVADHSAPGTIERVINTTGLSAFGGEWTTESGNDYLYPDSYIGSRVWKYQLTQSSPHDPVDGIWRLDEGTPGAILARLMAEWQASGRPQQPIPDATYAFDFNKDSDGNAWATNDGTLEFTASIGDLGMETVLRLIPYGVTVQMSPELVLGAYNGFGTNRAAAAFGAGKVRFRGGVNIADTLRRALPARRVDSHMLAQGEGNLFATSTDDDQGYVVEGFVATSLKSVDALTGTAAAELERERTVSEAIAFRAVWGNSELTGLYRPWTHYWVGDIVRIHTGTGEVDFNEEDARVYAITVAEVENGEWTATPELVAAWPVPGSEAPASSSSAGGGGGGSIGGSGSSGSGTTSSGGLTLEDPTQDAIFTAIKKIIGPDFYITEPVVGTAQVNVRFPVTPEGTLPWFVLSDYGAAGDDTTDDLAAITAWINDFNAAGGGVLYAPKPVTAYLTSAQPPVITGGGLMLGDGPGAFDSDAGGSMFHISSGSSTIFEYTPAGGILIVRGIATAYTGGGTPTAGSGYKVTPSTGLERVDFLECSARGFKINYDLQGTGWRRVNCKSYGWVDYSVKIRNTVIPDAGDWRDHLNDDWASVRNSLGMYLIQSSGGGEISGNKGNMTLDGFKAQDYIVLAPTASTSILKVHANSVENITRDMVHGTIGTGLTFKALEVYDNEVLISGNTGVLVNLVATDAGGFLDGRIGKNITITFGTARAAILLTKVDNFDIERQVVDGFNAQYTATTCTNLHDLTGGVAAGVLISGTPSVGQVPTATGAAAATWQTPSSSAPTSAQVRDAGRWNAVIDTGSGTGVVDGGDFVYEWSSSVT